MKSTTAFLQKGLGRIRKFLDDGVAKGKVPAEARDKTLASLTGTTRLDDLRDCDLVIEAIVENLDEKRTTYAALERVVSAIARSSFRIPRRSASPSSPRRHDVPTASADCTFSTRCR